MPLRLFSIFLFFGCITVLAQQPKVDQDRLEKRIVELAKFGLQENGETERVAFSDADVAVHLGKSALEVVNPSPEEFTSTEDMANGANVLLHTILALDKKL